VDGEPSTAGATGAADEDILSGSAERAARAWHTLGLRLRGVTPSLLARILLVAFGLFGVLWIIWISWAALLPFQIGIALAYILLPLVNRLDQWMPRWLAILLVFAVGGVVVVSLFVLVLAQVIDQTGAFINAMPTSDELGRSVEGLQRALDESPPEVQRTVNDVSGDVVTSVRSHLGDIVGSVANTISNVFTSLISTFTFLLGFMAIPFWLFITLKDQPHGKVAIDHFLPGWLRQDFWAVVRIADRSFSSYIRGQLFLGLLIGVLSYVGLTMIEVLGIGNVRFKLVLAVIAGFTEMIPLLGPVLGGIPAVLFGLFDSWQTGLAVFVVYFCIQQIESNLLAPRVVGNSVNIHPIILMPLLIILSRFGPLWIILAAPLAAVVRDLFRYAYGRLDDPPRPAGLLPGERMVVTPDGAAPDMQDPSEAMPPASGHR
jgi:predicted PurR-regulated permease PerM